LHALHFAGRRPRRFVSYSGNSLAQLTSLALNLPAVSRTTHQVRYVESTSGPDRAKDLLGGDGFFPVSRSPSVGDRYPIRNQTYAERKSHGIVGRPNAVGIAAAGLWLLATVNAKRLHDRDRSAWWLVAPALLLASIAVALSWGASGLMLAVNAAVVLFTLPITLWLVVEAGFLAGSLGPNRYGPEPVPQKAGPGAGAYALRRAVLWSPLGVIAQVIVLPIASLYILIGKRDFLFKFKGRMGRQGFWILSFLALIAAVVLNALVVYVCASLFGQSFEDADAGPMTRPVHLAFIGLAVWALAAIGGKRMHDRNHSAWWMVALSPLVLVVLVPLLGPSPALKTTVGLLLLLCCPFALWLIVQLGFLKGTPGPNRFGPDPNVV
jgi:uncharacterized membrane protein YhaH (DUF805 family)